MSSARGRGLNLLSVALIRALIEVLGGAATEPETAIVRTLPRM